MINIDKISFLYDDKVIFEDFSLALDKGKFYCLMGENGSGKSTLTKILLGIEKVASGEVTFNGINLAEKIYEVRKEVGMVFQNPDEQIVSDIVEEEIAFSMENYGYSSSVMNEKIDELLSLVNLNGKREAKVSNLSGGEKQRLCIASALALNPKLLIVDEGTAMLDVKNRENILSLLKKIQEKGVSIVLITHHLNELMYSDDVILLNKGKIQYLGDKEGFISSVIKGELGESVNLNGAFKIAKFIYEKKKIDISSDIFDLKKVGEHLWNCI